MTIANDETQVNEQNNNLETSPEVATGSVGQQGENDQNGVQKRINKVTAEKYDLKRELDQVKKQLEQASSNQDQANQKPVDTVNSSSEKLAMPELPSDVYDDEAMKNYHKQMADYTVKVSTVNQQSVQDAVKKQIEQQRQEAIQGQQQQQQQDVYNSYFKAGLDRGVDGDKLHDAGNLVGNVIADANLRTALLQDKNGAEIVLHLANNAADLHDIANTQNPIVAASKIEAVRQKALATVPAATSTPEPAPTFSNGGGNVNTDADFEIL